MSPRATAACSGVVPSELARRTILQAQQAKRQQKQAQMLSVRERQKTAAERAQTLDTEHKQLMHAHVQILEER